MILHYSTLCCFSIFQWGRVRTEWTARQFASGITDNYLYSLVDSTLDTILWDVAKLAWWRNWSKASDHEPNCFLSIHLFTFITNNCLMNPSQTFILFKVSRTVIFIKSILDGVSLQNVWISAYSTATSKKCPCVSPQNKCQTSFAFCELPACTQQLPAVIMKLKSGFDHLSVEEPKSSSLVNAHCERSP